MDPHFEVGDLGDKWRSVSSNTKVDLFLRFLMDCKSFCYDKCPEKFLLGSLNPDDTCLLKHVAEPLLWVTRQLKEKVQVFKEMAIALNLQNKYWEVKTSQNSLFSKNVVLAIGCEAKSLNYPTTEEISLKEALDPEKLAKKVKSGDTIGVFGSSHSAILILANLVALKANVINFYRSPHLYAFDLGDWILFDNTGLKGFAATWAKQHLDGNYPDNFKRVLTSDHKFDEYLALCNKAIYAVGFEQRKVPVLEQYETLSYNNKTGIIAPGLFGFGIAFPQAQFDPMMNLEHRVGLWKFMDYLNTILPIWQRYSN